MRNRTYIVVALVCAALSLGGCGGDDTADSEATEAAEGGDETCEPVNPELEGDADQTVPITLTDYQFAPPAVEVAAGTITFATSNEGGEAHELAVLPGGGEVPFVEPGVPDEAALEAAGAFELEGYGPGQDCNATWELEPGDYTLFCILEASDGETHYEKGMEASLTVTG